MIRHSTLAAIVLVLTSLAVVQAQSESTQLVGEQARTLNLSAYAELLRADVHAQKVAILTEMMGFTEEQDKAFWPIYRDYDTQMSKLGDERLALIEEYAKAYSQMTDAVALSLASRAMDLQTRRNAALERGVGRVSQALSPTKALQFLQVEHQLLLVIDLQIAASLPVAP